MKRDVYIKDVKDFVFDLNVERNAKGDFIEKVEKTDDEKKEIDWKNQVYERVFIALENKSSTPKPDEGESTESIMSDDSLEERQQGDNLRDKWIAQ